MNRLNTHLSLLTIVVVISSLACSTPKPFQSSFKEQIGGYISPDKKIAYLGYFHFNMPETKVTDTHLQFDSEYLTQQINKNTPSELSRKIHPEYMDALKIAYKFNRIEDVNYLSYIENGNQILISFLNDNHRVIMHEIEKDPNFKYYFTTYGRLNEIPYLGGSTLIAKSVSGPAFEKMKETIDADYLMYSMHFSADYHGSEFGLTISSYRNSWSNIVVDYVVDLKTGKLVEWTTNYVISPLDAWMGASVSILGLRKIVDPSIDTIEKLNFKTFKQTLIHNRSLSVNETPRKYVPLLLPGDNQIKICLPVVINKGTSLDRNKKKVSCTFFNKRDDKSETLDLKLGKTMGSQAAKFVALPNNMQIAFATYVLIDDLNSFLGVSTTDKEKLIEIFINQYEADLFSFKIESERLEHSYEF